MMRFAIDHIAQFYFDHHKFPANNNEEGVPAPNKIIGNQVTGVEGVNGVIHVTLGNKVPDSLQGKTLSFRHAVFKSSPISPIAWLCGYDNAVEGMEAVGENKTGGFSKFLDIPVANHF
ncbi:pilin [Spartinivicinus poritis]|uniref:Pilin n=1 Tax=Spartinivicinus poritis TaxID=2994640 RepID=A0ABT5UER4_9GAMM|nr:pilin [Spartinivicinus sp. A2-2]MDE1464872.1 pilin [Spartinivicinus sp. A2-2]